MVGEFGAGFECFDFHEVKGARDDEGVQGLSVVSGYKVRDGVGDDKGVR